MKSQAPVRARRVGLIALLGALAVAGTAACAAKVEEKPRQPEVSAQELRQKGGRQHHGPVGVVIEAARKHASPSAEQLATLDTLEGELSDGCASHRALHDKLKASAVTVVRSGTARTEEFEKSVELAVGAIEEKVQRGTDALEEVHAILDTDQRKAVAAALRARVERKFGPKPGNDQRPREGFRRLSSHLMLSSLQIDKLMTVKKELLGEKRELRPSREEMYSLIDAFERDDFPTALDAFRTEKLRILRERVKRAGERTDSVLSVFTAEQRELLADLILDGPQKVLLGDAVALSRTSRIGCGRGRRP